MPDTRDALPVPDTTANPMPLPVWATRSISEDGGITHETVSRLQPQVRFWHEKTRTPTEVGLSVTDLPTDGRWTRSAPTIQIEGGSYPLEDARHLRDAIDELLHAADTDPDPDHLPQVS